MTSGANVLYEPGSTRGDYGTLVITASNPCIIPFYFEIPCVEEDGENPYLIKILPQDKVVFLFKKDERLMEWVLRKEYTNTNDNVVFLVLNEKDLRQFYGNREYVLGVNWYDRDGNIKQVLIPKLTVRVEGVVQYAR